MESENKITGSCLCGAVSYQFTGPIKSFQYCHCSRCRKFTGTAHAANIIVDPKHFQWLTGKEFVGRFELPEVKYFATSFCKQCGSSLPWKTKTGTALIVTAGTLDDDPGQRPDKSIYYASRAPWYCSVDDLPKHDELPVKKQ